MKLYFIGGVGARSGALNALLNELNPLLRAQGHTVVTTGPVETEQGLFDSNLRCISNSDVVLAPVDAPTMELGGDLMEAMRIEKPVLCFTDGKHSVKSAMLIGADALGMLEMTAYRNVNDLADKICKFARQVEASRRVA